MKLQFDANQQFQLDAVTAVTELFDGQPQGAPEFSVINVSDWGDMFAGQSRTELGVGNRLLLAEEKLGANTRLLQVKNVAAGPGITTLSILDFFAKGEQDARLKK